MEETEMQRSAGRITPARAELIRIRIGPRSNARKRKRMPVVTQEVITWEDWGSFMQLAKE
jgi:hypothetical protein